jgi:hypothetical protein
MDTKRNLIRIWLLVMPAVVNAQFTYTTNNATITIIKYTGSGGGRTGVFRQHYRRLGVQPLDGGRVLAVAAHQR